MVSTHELKQWGPLFEPCSEHNLHGVCTFCLCLRGFPSTLQIHIGRLAGSHLNWLYTLLHSACQSQSKQLGRVEEEPGDLLCILAKNNTMEKALKCIKHGVRELAHKITGTTSHWARYCPAPLPQPLPSVHSWMFNTGWKNVCLPGNAAIHIRPPLV